MSPTFRVVLHLEAVDDFIEVAENPIQASGHFMGQK